jgi:hypothetical protein
VLWTIHCDRRARKNRTADSGLGHTDLRYWRSIIVVHVDGVRLCLWTAASNGPIFHPSDDTWICKAMVEWYWQGKPEELRERETCPSVTLSTTYPTWTNSVVNPAVGVWVTFVIQRSSFIYPLWSREAANACLSGAVSAFSSCSDFNALAVSFSFNFFG